MARSLPRPVALVLISLSACLTLARPAAAGSFAKSFGTAQNEAAGRVEPTADGGFIVAGATFTGSTNYLDGLVIKLDKFGAVVWSKTYGGTSDDGFLAIKPTWDGGFIATGYTVSYGTYGSRDLWLVKMSHDGTVLWEGSYGGAYEDEGYAVVQCPDGNYAAAGYTLSAHGTGTDYDAFLLKVSFADGTPVWETTFGGDTGAAKPDGDDRLLDLDLLADGNLVAVGFTDSWGDQPSDQHVLVLVVAASDGSLLLQRYYDQDYDEWATGVCATPDGGCLLTGFAHSGTGQGDDLFAMKLNSDLTIQYQQRYGGTGQDRGASIQQTHESDGLGGYYTVVAGFDGSSAGSTELWVLKLDGQLRAGSSYPGTWQKRYGGSSADSGTSIREAYDGGYIACANTGSYGAGNDDVWVLKLPADGVIDTGCQEDTSGILSSSFALETPDGATTSPTWSAAPTDTPGAPTVLAATQCLTCFEDSYEPDDSCFTTASVLHGGESQVHNFCDGSSDWIAFNACEGESYTVSTSGTSVDTILEIYGTDCSTLVDSDTGGGAASVTWVAAGSGTYHIKVGPDNGFSGEYTVGLTGTTTPCPGGTWSQFYSGPVPGHEYARYGAPTSDGGMVVVGNTASFGLVTTDLWAMKLDRLGVVEWEKAFGGSGYEEGTFVEEASDGGFLVAGFTDSFSSGGDFDGWLLKLDASGAVVWQKTFGGTGDDTLIGVRRATAGGYVAAGRTPPAVGDDPDLWMLRLDDSGNTLWEKTYSGPMYAATADYLKVKATAEGGYAVACTRTMPDTANDFWIVKLDPWGGVQWQVAYGGTYEEQLYGFDQMADGSYGAAGLTNSFEASLDTWVVKLGPFGQILWQNGYGDTGDAYQDYAFSVRGTFDGGMIFAGTSDGYSPGNLTFGLWLVKLDGAGAIDWQMDYEVSTYDEAFCAVEMPDGGYAVAGLTDFFEAFSYDLWALQTDSSGGIPQPSCTVASASSGDAAGTTGSPIMTVASTATPTWTPDSPSVTVTGTGSITGGNPPVFGANNTAADADDCADTGVAVTWTTPTSWGSGGGGSRGFNVYRDTIPSGTPVQLNGTLLPDTDTSLNDDTGTHGTTYLYFVEAINGCALSTLTAGATAQDFVASVPSGLSNNTAADAHVCDDTGVTVTWSAPSSWGDNGTGTRTFDIFRSDNPGTPIASGLSSATTSYDDNTGTNNTTYTYTVRANNGCALHATTSGASAMDFVASAPSGLSNNTAADTHVCDDTGVTVTWSAPSSWGDNGTGSRTFDIFRSDSPGTPLVSGLSASTMTYGDTSGTNNTSYTYTVRANNGCALATTTAGASAMDFVASAPVLANNTAADAHPCADTGITVSWATPSPWGDNGTGTRTFDIFRSDDPGTPVATGLSSGATSYNDTTGANGTSYTYTVRANNGCALSTTTAGASATDFVASAPSGLSNNTAADAHVCDDTGVTVTWSAPSSWGDDGTGTRTFDIFRSDNPGTPIAAGLAAGATSYNDNAGTNGTTYTYTVRANSGCALSTTTAGASAMDFVASAPALANNAAADAHACDDTGVTVSWTAPSSWGDNGTGTRTFDIFRSDNPGTPLVSGLSSSATSYDDTTGTNGTTFTYTVRANNGCALSTTTAGASAMDFVASAPVLANNTAADAHACDDTGVTVSWTVPSPWGDNGTGTRTFDIFRSDNPGTPIASGLTSGVTSYNDTTGTDGTTYTYSVRANNGCALSTTTAGASAMDFVASSPSGLSNNTAADLDTCADTGVKVDWTDPSSWGDNGTGTRTFDIFRSDNPGTPIASGLSATTHTYTDTAGTNGTAYTYTVRANSGCALSTTTAGASAMDFVASAPALANNAAADAHACDDTGVTVSWTAPSSWGDNGTGTRTFDIFRSDNPGTPIASGLSSGATSYDDTTGTNGTTYTYTVRANNGCALATTTAGASAMDFVASAPALANNAAADAHACEDTGVTVSWSTPSPWGDNGNGTRTFDIFRSDNPGTPLVSGLTSGATSYNDTTGTNGTSYTYTVRANNGCALSTTTAGASAMDFAASVPALANNTATDVSTCADTGVRVDWTAPSSWGDNGNGTRTFDIFRSDNLVTPLVSGLASGIITYTDLTGTNGASYTYTVRANNGCTLSTTTAGASASDVDNTPTPTITGASSNTCPSLTVDLSTQTGKSSYQWYRNGSPISGANSDAYTVSLSGTYTVSYTESGCSGTSAGKVVTLTVAPSGSYSFSASDNSLCQYDGIRISWGTDPTSWGDNGTNAGARSYTILRNGSVLISGIPHGDTQHIDDTVTPDTSYGYQVRYVNGCGQYLTSSYRYASDTEGSAVRPTISGNSKNICPDNFCDLETQEGMTFYQWYKSGNPISGANSYTYRVTDLGYGSYTVYVESSTCNGTSSGKSVTISFTAPSVSTNNTAADVSSCAATGVQVGWPMNPSNWNDGTTGTRTYTVLRDGSPLAAGTGLAYGTTSFTDTTAVLGQAYTYKVRYSNGCELTTDTAGTSATDANNTPAPAISGASANTCPSPTVTLSTASGKSSYKWYFGGAEIGGATSNTYDAAASGTYTVSYVENGCTGTSAGHAVTISATAPSGLSNNTASDVSSCAATGNLIGWSADPSAWNDGGNGTRTYTVLRDGSPLAAGTGLAYGTTSFTDTTAVLGQAYTYKVRYSNGCQITSDTAGATATDVDQTPTPAISGGHANTCPSPTVTLTTASGKSNYKWYIGGSEIGGATSNTYDAAASGAYTVSYEENGCSATSANWDVTISYSAPSGLSNNTAADLAPCAATGNRVTWDADPSTWNDGTTGTRTYTVLRDGSPLAAGTGLAYGTTSFTDTTAVLGQTYSYKVRYSNGCELTTDTAGASATDENNTPTPTISGASANTCPSLTVSLSTQTGMSDYQWYLGGSPISGANADTLVVGASGSYTVSYQESHGCTATSGGHDVTIAPCAAPPVPDGRTSGSAMRATKLSGTSLRVTYDTTTCPTAGASYNILYGNLGSVGSYTFSGSLCGVAEGSYDWSSLPSGNIFWVIVTEVGTKESSWGQKYTGGSYTQRSTSPSGLCSSATIDTSSTCP